MRRLRTTGLATVMALALIACFSVSTASATSWFNPDEYVADVKGTPEASSTWTLYIGGFTCKAGFTGNLQGYKEELQTSIPDHTCEGGLKVTMNGCGFIFRVGKKLAPNEYSGFLDIGNAPGKTCTSIVLKYWDSCQWNIAPTKNETGVTIRENEGEPPTLTISVKESFNVTGSGGLCTSGGTLFTGSWEASAYKAGTENPVSLNIITSDQPSFGANSYNVFGSQGTGEDAFAFIFNYTIKCTSVTSKNIQSIPTLTFSTQPTYKECTSSKGQFANVWMNTCSYVFSTAKAGFPVEPPYVGGMGVECWEGGDSLEVAIYSSKANYEANKPLCLWSIAPHGGLANVDYTNDASYSSLNMDLNVTGVTATKISGPLIPCGGATQSVTYGGELDFSGLWLW